MLETYNNTKKINSDYLTTEKIEYLENNIDYCEIYYLNNNGSITSIIKKK
jgi:hypothetical protein